MHNHVIVSRIPNFNQCKNINEDLHPEFEIILMRYSFFRKIKNVIIKSLNIVLKSRKYQNDERLYKVTTFNNEMYYR